MQVRPATEADVENLPTLHSAAVRAFGPGHYDAKQVDHWAGRGERTPDDHPVNRLGVKPRGTVLVYL